ncbi:hypothetical protein QBC42DRAFT_167624 [Cladorrhinum samala]|uniref:Uncharacterized protein n=1 Tax=Cladorrhinum samala TaxID=585594 RepID=A0AAV9I286_9PEZI|nr:hypothetical protein QBC42DRAFT_167624 [Cladorrhinum samala]
MGAGASASRSSTTLTPSEASAAENAFHIFNSIHSAMRLWGSSLNHNGLSAFLATVPEGTILYHGSSHPEPPTTADWLAFEIEHGEWFARAIMVPPPQTAQDANPLLQHRWHRAQRQPSRPGTSSEPQGHGYLHLYRATKPLRLLYLDGMSAGNTNMGTLDMQDYLLRGNRSAELWEEYERAQSLCDLVTPWGLQGLIRTEAGFEIVKCDFSDSMEFLAANQRPEDGDSGLEGYLDVQMFENMRSLSQRYHGIGANRVALDFSSMVSPMFYPVNLTNPDPNKQEPHLRRLTSVTDQELRAIKARVEEVVRDRVDGKQASVDWQGVTDMIVTRYADRLWDVAETVDSLRVLQGVVNGLLNSHIDYSVEDEGYERAITNCAKHYVQFSPVTTEQDHLISVAIGSVTQAICATLFDVRKVILDDADGASDETLAAAKGLLKSLNSKLRWSRWKECTSCSSDEVCFVPMWPVGDKDSFDRPNCRNVTTIQKGWIDNRYWEPRFPLHGPEKPDDGSKKEGEPKDL